MAKASRSLWSGSISFGLVNIPVKMVTAIQAKDVYFHLLHKKDNVRLKQKLYCPADQEEVPRTEAVKGYNVGQNRVVVLQPEELEALFPKARRTIELLDFVNLKDIDSLYFDHPYYLVPDKEADKPYRLFLEALARSGKVGIGTFVMRNKQYLAALRALDSVICLETMYYNDELTKPDEAAPDVRNVKVDPKELAVAQQLIQALTKSFKPEKYHDEYREAVLKLIQDRAKGKKAVAAPEPKPLKAATAGLLAALEESLKEVEQYANRNGSTRRRKRAELIESR